MAVGKRLSVRLYGKPVGVLEQDVIGKMHFTYLPEATQPLSLSLPLQESAYGQEVCEAYFGGLLPEGEPARRAIGMRFGINPKNTFSLLKAIGYDCAGAVSLHDSDEPVREMDPVPLTGRILTEAELACHIRELPRKPLFIGVEGLRLSLAGAQDKAAVCLMDGQIALPQHGCPTTHILKPAIDLLEETVQNEYLCLRIAHRLGIQAAHAEIRQAEGIPYLLVARYDRYLSEDGRISRIHQEDFCQALGVPSAYKYQREGGPGFRECFDLLRRTTRPVLDRNQLAELMVFNFLMGNTDAHGKNFSLLHGRNGEIRMAPAYDILCTRVYSGLTDRLAMKVGSEYEMPRIFPRHWEALCKQIGFSYPALKKTVLRQCDVLPVIIRQEVAELQATCIATEIPSQILNLLEEQCDLTRRQFTQAS